jgi:hypothetical protein
MLHAIALSAALTACATAADVMTDQPAVAEADDIELVSTVPRQLPGRSLRPALSQGQAERRKQIQVVASDYNAQAARRRANADRKHTINLTQWPLEVPEGVTHVFIDLDGVTLIDEGER